MEAFKVFFVFMAFFFPFVDSFNIWGNYLRTLFPLSSPSAPALPGPSPLIFTIHAEVDSVSQS